MENFTIQLSDCSPLAVFIDLISDPILIINKQGNILLANQASLNLLGYKQSEFVKKSISDCIPAWNESILYSCENLKIQSMLLTTDAIEIPIELHVSYFHDQAEQTNCILLKLIDTSFDKEIEKEIVKCNKEINNLRLLNDALLDISEYSIIVKDLEGKIILWNKGAEKNYYYTDQEIIGLNSSILHSCEDLSSGKVAKFFNDALKNGMSEELFERRRKNGDYFSARSNLFLRKNENGTPIGFILISKDITEQKQLEVKLRLKNLELEEQNLRVQQANRLKSEFLANMLHELRTPLNAIIGFSDLMYSGKLGLVSEDHKEYLHDILSNAHHLLNLINDILNLSKIETGKMEFTPEKINLNTVLNDVKNILLSLLAKKRIQLEINIDAELNNIFIDSAKLKQILYNLISNAIKFSNEKGRVKINIIAVKDDNFCIEVHDEGIGIREEDVKNLFIEFQQLDASTAKKYQGTGLGLALTKRIVEAQHGTIRVVSTINAGSSFYVILPRIYKNITSDFIYESTALSSSHMPTILIIEDDAQDRRFIKQCLTNAGYAVDVATTGEEALRLSRLRHYEAAIIDLLLPDMNGWDVLKKFRNEFLNKHIPVIIVTVIAEKRLELDDSIQDFLIKPFEPELLLHTLKKSKILPYFPRSILVVDNNLHDLKLAQTILDEYGYKVTCESNSKKALNIAIKNNIDAIILDLLMPEMNGFDFLNQLRRTHKGKNMIVIIWTAKELDEEEWTKLKNSANTVVVKGKDTTQTLVSEIQYYTPRRTIN